MEAVWKLPEYIGHPGYQHTVAGTGDSMLFEKTLNDTLQIAYIRPLVPKMLGNINLYRGDPNEGWSEYVSYLEANNIIEPKDKQLKVVLSQIQPLAESYSNEFGPSELASGIQSIASGGLQEFAFINDYSKDKLAEMAQGKGIVAGAADMYKNATEGIGNIVGKFTSSELGQQVSNILANPTQKIDIPNMWKGCSFTSSYQITIRLYCFEPSNDTHFTELILAPLGALLMFCTPRSDQGDFYTWPFMMEFTIPGQAYIPLGYCQSLDVVKGGDVSDISWIKRPGTVDLRMTINTVFGVKTNSKAGVKDTKQRPTIIQDLQLMSGMVPLKQPKSIASYDESASGGVNEDSSGAEGGYDSTTIQNHSAYNDLNIENERVESDQEAEEAADALAGV